MSDSEESLIFSVFGLTVRGFDFNDEKWVPKEGQRLTCTHVSGPVDVREDGQSVGSVATEAAKKFKEWLRANGEIEAVVLGIQKKHKGTKGMEVPVLYVFTSIKESRMINLKRALIRDILKLKKKKKSIEIKEGDASKGMTFPDTNDSQYEFSISGMTMRGFDVYQSIWVPEKGNRILCSVSTAKSVEMLKDDQTIGNVQTEGQKLFRKFINATGVIHAVVDAEPKHHKTKGEEIPVIYQFSANVWTKRLQNIRNEIRNDIQKRSLRKKSLKFICSNSESQNEAGTSYGTHSEDLIDGVGENMSSTKANEQMQHSGEAKEQNIKDETEVSSANNENIAGGSGENIPKGEMSNEKVDTIQKRRSSESAGGSVEKIRKTFIAPEGKTPVKSSALSASKRTPNRKRSSPLTPVSTNKITNYFSPKTSKSAESYFGNVQESNPAKKRLMQKDEKEDGDRRTQEGNVLNVSGKAKFYTVPAATNKSFGAFIDTHGIVEPITVSEAIVKASASVCKIVFPTTGGVTGSGSGFRVGSRYIMTALHVAKALPSDIQNATETFAMFNYKIDGIAKEEDQYLINRVVYADEITDIAVIELLDHPRGMPPPLTSFLTYIPKEGFYLIGHSQGYPMGSNTVNKILDKDCPKFRQELAEIREKSKKHTGGRSFDTEPYDIVLNPNRFTFQCKFTKGASGAPGIVPFQGETCVATVLLHGYPDWYYEHGMEAYKTNWPDEYCIQQGANLLSVRDMMHASNPDLCQDIFGPQQQQ